MTDVVEWLRGKAAWSELNNAYGSIAQAISSLADELEQAWKPRAAEAAETGSTVPDEPPVDPAP